MMITCPLINKKIDEYDCFETGTVAEEIVKITSSVGIPEIKQTPGFRKRCLECEHHIE